MKQPHNFAKARLLKFSHLISYFPIAISKRKTYQKAMYILGAITEVKSISDLRKIQVANPW